MTRFVTGIYFLLACVLLSVRGIAQEKATPPMPNAATQILYALFDAEWEYQLAQHPESATYRGDTRYNDRLTDMSLAAIATRQAHVDTVLAKLRHIDRAELAAADQLNYDLFEREYISARESRRFKTHLMPVDQLKGPQLSFPSLVAVMPFASRKDYANYLQRIAAFPGYLDQVITLMQAGIAEHWVMPKISLHGVPDQIKAQYAGAIEKLPLAQPFMHLPDSFAQNEKDSLQSYGLQQLREKVVPAYAKFDRFFTEEYLPAARSEVGAWALPDGKRLYENRVRFFTTTNLTPQEVHEIGLLEVARIRKEMQAVIEQVGFQGSFQEFIQFLRTDPRFYFTKAEDLVVGYRDICKRIDPELTKLFGKLPRTPYGVRPIPDYDAPTRYTAYYQSGAADGSRPGYYYVNTYRLETRPKYEMEALSLHESVPGHHLQIALAQELENVPEFRKSAGFTAFVEGWALYAESLGEAMGFFTDPYSKFGQLTYEMWRACRLVVDTGMHDLRWDRQQAIDFMLANTAKTAHDITNEVDRYIVWPGQALAYKIGELKIKELRALAEKELGDRLDIREFHDTLLGNGALPLDVLEVNMKAYITAKKPQR